MATDGIDVSYWQGTIDWDKVKANELNLQFFAAVTEAAALTPPLNEMSGNVRE